jgi:hypothetical protein
VFVEKSKSNCAVESENYGFGLLVVEKARGFILF